jgi:HEAT repeat protein
MSILRTFVACLVALSAIGPTAAGAPAASPRVRASAISALAVRGDRSLLPAVIPRLDDENETVKFNAAAAIVRLESGTAK